MIGRRVVVTGLGMVSPAGLGVNCFMEVVTAGKSCAGLLTKFEPSEYQVCRVAAEIKNFDPTDFMSRHHANLFSKAVQYSVVAGKMAVEDSGFKLKRLDPNRVGVSMGTSIGGIVAGGNIAAGSLSDQARQSSIGLLVNSVPVAVSAGLGFVLGHVQGPTTLMATGCTASADAISWAYDAIKHGKADLMIAGGSEAPIEPITMTAFDMLGALTARNNDPTRASRPFDKNRDGFVIAEGSGVLILEDMGHAIARDAKIYGEIIGSATTLDAYHMTASRPDLKGSAKAIELALERAQIQPTNIDYVSAHGTSTPLNDAQETDTIKKVFGHHAYNLAISSIKSMLGHSSGAAGSMQAVSCCLALTTNILPPTINYETPDAKCDLDYITNKARKQEINFILQNTYAFSGKNTALLYKRFVNN